MKKTLSLGLIAILLNAALPFKEAYANECHPQPGQCINLRGNRWTSKKYCPPENKLGEKEAKIYFATAGWMVCPNDDASLREFLGKNPKADRMIIEGYADARGPEDLNQDLGGKRCGAIEERLRGFGYKGGFERTSYGESKAQANERDPNQLALDRRVTLLLDQTVIKRALDLLPADVYLLDSSSSMAGNKIKTVREFKYPKGAHLYDFGPNCRTATKLSDARTIQANCGTPLWTSLYDLVNQTEKSKTITVLTDGANTGCCRSPKEIIGLARSKSIKINTIGIDAIGYDSTALQGIAKETGGNFYISK